ncbi:MAG: putative quinol monooxygenase [Ahrensia sp.]|nr:putative quinol monooxygenase [Ahrensia sp.]
MIYIIATLSIKPGTFDQVMALATPCIEATRKEDGCLSYDLHRSVNDENTLVFVERWRDMDAIKAHFVEPHLVAWRDGAEGLIADKKIEIITPEDVKVL